MSLLIVCVLAFFFGVLIKYLTRKKNYFQFKASPFAIGCFLSAVTYYIFSLQYFSLDFLIPIQDDWTGGMVVMIVQDGIITAILFSSLIFLITDQILLRQKKLSFNLKCIIIIVLTIGIFILIVTNELSEFSMFNFSPSFWKYN